MIHWQRGAGSRRVHRFRARFGKVSGPDAVAIIASCAGVAQSAERLTRNEQVRGSIPLSGSGGAPVAPIAGCPAPYGRRGVEAVDRMAIEQEDAEQ